MRHGYIVTAFVRDPAEVLRAYALKQGRKWKVTTSGSVVVRLSREAGEYVLPSELHGEDVQVQVRADEMGAVGSFAYVVAGPAGEPLRPYAVLRKVDASEWHGSMTCFARPSLSRVGWFKGRDGLSLSIDRARVETKGGTVRLIQENLLEEMHVGPPTSLPDLPGAVAGWRAAVEALYERLYCKDACRGHFVV